MIGIGLADVGRLNIGDLEGAQPDEPAQLEHHGPLDMRRRLDGVGRGRRRSSTLCTCLLLRRLKSHVGYQTLRREVYCF